MYIISIILASILLIITFIGCIKDDPDNKGFVLRLISGSITISLLVIIIAYLCINGDDYPSALDVYRGKTELVTTQKIKNDIVVSVDSTVVYKK